MKRRQRGINGLINHEFVVHNMTQIEEQVLSMMENTDFFLKIMRVKFESKDPELQQQAIEELKEFRILLENHQK